MLTDQIYFVVDRDWPMRASVFFLVTLLSIAPPACFSAEFSFEAVGEVRCTTFDEDGTNTYFSRFKAAISGCQTLIRSKLLLDDDPDYGADYHEYTCQGSNSTLLVRFRDDLMVTNATRENLGVTETIKLEKPQRAWNQGTVFARPDPLPPYGFEALTAVWLAYGSPCHYGKSGQDSVSPVVFVGDEFRESGFKVRSNWVVENKPPGFLEFMAEFSDGNSYRKRGSEVEVEPLPKPFDTGFTNAIFRTLEWTKVAGYTLPRKFELVAFQPDYSEKSQMKLKIAYMMAGETHSITLGTTRTNFASELPERCNVIDYSHQDERSRTHYFTYRATDGKLISHEEFLEQQRARSGER
jgi:hypothetical protein